MSEPQSSPVYVDANPITYLVEGHDELAESVRELFTLFRSRPGLAVTSELTLAEVLVKAPVPYRRVYLDLIVWSGMFDLRAVSRNILTETAAYRRASVKIEPDGRKSMVKLPDAIHVVTAIRSDCKRILSNDARMRLPEGFQRVTPDHVGISRLLRELA